MEYEKISEAGKLLKWHVDEHTKVPEEVHTRPTRLALEIETKL